MKFNFVFWMIIVPVMAKAQNATIADSLAQEKIRELEEVWTLGIDSTADAVDMRMYNRFKTLFDLSATIDDAFDVRFFYPGEKAGNYKSSNLQKPFDVYAHNMALRVKSLRLDSFYVIQANTANPDSLVYIVALKAAFQKQRRYILPDDYVSQVITTRRRIRFESTLDSAKAASALAEKIGRTEDSTYRFSITDTLQIVMTFRMDSVSIKRITSRGTRLICLNDDDNDAVLNQEDSLALVAGDFTSAGRPDYDLDGITNEKDKCPTTYSITNQGCPPSYFISRNEFSVFIGVQMNTQNIILPELNQLGYLDPSGSDAMDVLQSSRGALKSPGQMPGFFAGGNFAHFFGQDRKRRGLSIGFTYSKFAGAYELTDPIIYTYKATDGTNFYRRQLTISELTEEMDFTVVNVPFLFNYRFYLTKKAKTVVNLRAGPSFMFFQTQSSYQAVIDFGGLYQIDTLTRNRITYYDLFNPGSKYNLFLTSAAINAANPANQNAADSVFRQLAAKNYDFASNKNYSGAQTISRSAIAFHGNIDLQHKVSDGLTVKAGLHYTLAPSLKAPGKYKPIDKTTDEFQSVFNGNAKPTYSAIGLALGFVFNF